MDRDNAANVDLILEISSRGSKDMLKLYKIRLNYLRHCIRERKVGLKLSVSFWEEDSSSPIDTNIRILVRIYYAI